MCDGGGEDSDIIDSLDLSDLLSDDALLAELLDRYLMDLAREESEDDEDADEPIDLADLSKDEFNGSMTTLQMCRTRPTSLLDYEVCC